MSHFSKLYLAISYKYEVALVLKGLPVWATCLRHPFVHGLNFQQLRDQLTESVLITVEVKLPENKKIM